jgi:hypothetical protein
MPPISMRALDIARRQASITVGVNPEKWKKFAVLPLNLQRASRFLYKA